LIALGGLVVRLKYSEGHRPGRVERQLCRQRADLEDILGYAQGRVSDWRDVLVRWQEYGRPSRRGAQMDAAGGVLEIEIGDGGTEGGAMAGGTKPGRGLWCADGRPGTA